MGNRMEVIKFMSQSACRSHDVWYHWYKYSTENSVAKGQRSSMVKILLALNGKMNLVPVNYLFLICFGKRCGGNLETYIPFQKADQISANISLAGG